tara:strand:- start:4 stop:555 length:552 start_codon:yes stop_codon:yes gene_type:complete
MFFAVRNGKEGSKIYSSWHYAKENSQNIKGAKCKKFKEFKDATNFLEESDHKSESDDVESHDNSCHIYINTKGNKPSEWFLKIEVPGHDTIRKKGKLNCSDRQAELYATVKGLDKIKFLKDYKIYLHVSDYIKNGIKDWLLTWIDNGWKTSENKEVKYVDLWKNINTLIEGFQWKNIKFSSQR